jgi:hypothetical protein
MKSIFRSSVSVLLMLQTVNVLADVNSNNFNDKGFYLTGQAGQGVVNLGFMDNLFGPISMEKNKGFAGRLGAGYQVNRYFGLESGLTLYPSAVRNYNSERQLFGYVQYDGDSKISNIYSADLMGLIRIPVGNHFFISAGVGVAAMHFSYSAMNVRNQSNTHTVLQWDAAAANFVAPKAEVRIGTKVNQEVSVYLSGSHIFSNNGHNAEERNYQPSLDMLSIGFSYDLQ